MDFPGFLFLSLLIAVLATCLGIALGRFLWPATRRVDAEALARAQADLARLEQQCSELRSRAEQLAAEHTTAQDVARRAGEEAARLTERVANLDRQVADQTSQAQALQAERDALIREAKETAAEIARLKEREATLTQQLETQVAQVADLQKQLTVEFENIAGRILKASAGELSETSRKALDSILAPLRERIQDFQARVQATYEAESREVLSLKEQIRMVLETSHAIGSQADDLAKALRGDSQLRGRWGELALERILEAAGLTEGREYIAQGRGLGLKSESGGAQKPDVIIVLPEGRTMIVDSKLSLVSYEQLVGATDKAEAEARALQLVRDLKVHIDGLAGKRYQENSKLQAHDCLLMFVPIEGALAAALTKDPELFIYAWDRHIVLVGPSTLLMTLRTVASIWRYELQGQNALEIARLAGDLCDKVSTSIGDLNTAAEKMRGALDAHNEAVKRLSTGKGNVLSLGARMQALGVKTRKATPTVQIDGVPLNEGAETSNGKADQPIEVA